MRLVWEASPRRFLVSLAPQAVSAISTGAQLVIARDLIAAVLAAGSDGALGHVSYLLAALIALNLVGSAAGLVQSQQQQLLGVIVERHTNSILLDRIIAIDLKRFETPEFQDLLRRATNALGRMMGITASAIGVARSIFLIIGVGAALYLLQPVLLGLAIVGFVPMWLASAASSRQTYQFWRSMTPNERQRSYVFGLFTMREYAKELRAFGLAPYLRGLYERLSNERLRELAASLRRRARYSILSSGVSSIVTAMTYGALAYLVIDHRIGLAEAGAAVAASQQLSLQLGSLSANLSQLYESSLFLEDWEEFSSLAAARPPLKAVPAAPFERIELDHVSFRYPPSTSTDGSTPVPSRLALDDVSLEIRAGEVVALVGENGSGKTTLAKVLSGLYKPDSGQVLWDGVDAATRHPRWVYERVAVLFQDFARFMLTARENIGLGRVERIEDFAAIVDAAQRAGADTFMDEWPERYDTVLGAYFLGGKDVSIGQWQRIALARAFFRDAPLVILDEPTAALDARAEHDLFTRMRDLFGGRSVLLISHRFSSVRSADRIYVLHEGRVVEHGSHDELMELGGLYNELFTLQASAYLPGPRAKTA
jgi:ATP-binding cassette subfamily B protein